jgi:porphyrinogen peroxidase
MIEPQDVLAPLSRAALVLVVTVHEGEEQAARVRELGNDLAGLVRAVGFRDLEATLSCVVGFGAEVWPRLVPGSPPPMLLHPFAPISGARHDAPATPGDVVFHIRATRPDLCFELATQILVRLRGAVTPVDEAQGFRFFDFRDLLGFVDGTENPDGPLAVSATQIGDEDPDFAGGCYVHVQKYVHDMSSWNSLSVTEQERVVGRTKLDDIELDDDEKPANSHLALNVIEDEEGNELKIVRHNMPFGEIGKGEFGTYFIGYSRTAAVTEQMLRNMFIGDPPGNTDRILDFSIAVTGTMFFTPTVDFLNDPPPLPNSASEQAPAVAGRVVDDGSLGIGSLKGIPG